MQLGSLLIAKGLISKDDLERAVAHQQSNGGRLGDCLVELGLLSAEQIEGVMREAPQSPRSLADTDLDPVFLLQLMVKGMYTESLETPSQIAKAMKLPSAAANALLESAVERKVAEAAGQSQNGNGAIAEMRYTLSRVGRDWATESLEQCQYFGPAPVSLDAYRAQIMRQRIGNERVTRPMMDEAFADLVIPERFLGRLGPAINSSSAILIHGPAGNGKTTIAEKIGAIFQDVIYIPYCFEVDGQIVKVFDPSVHHSIQDEAGPAAGRGLRREQWDQRWVPCQRPMVVTGGELTLGMLDLKFNEIAKFYEAPLHIKALNGTFLIDDFGRQLAKPEDILNRWIVPLNSRVDYLSLHTGKSIQLPFDELVIFSTNMRPNDLMDPAFQRRISYKLKTVAPSEPLFRQVFEELAAKHDLELTDEIYRQVIKTIRASGAPLAYFQPKFIVEQVLVSCKFEGVEPCLTRENVEDAMLNLFVDDDDDAPAPAPEAAADEDLAAPQALPEEAISQRVRLVHDGLTPRG